MDHRTGQTGGGQPMHSKPEHVKAVEDAVTGTTPEQRFDQFFAKAKAHYDAEPTLEGKHAIVEAAFKDLPTIKVGIFDVTR